MDSIEKHNELSERFDGLTDRLKEMSVDGPDYKKAWDERAGIKQEMHVLEKDITC